MELTFVGEGIETEEIIVVYEGQTLFDAIAVLLPKTGIVAEEILVLIDEEDAAADLQGYAAHPGHMGKRHHIRHFRWSSRVADLSVMDQGEGSSRMGHRGISTWGTVPGRFQRGLERECHAAAGLAAHRRLAPASREGSRSGSVEIRRSNRRPQT